MLYLIFHVAATGLSHVAEHFGEYPFQGVVGNLAKLGSVRILNGLVTVVADVEGGAVKMA